MRKILFALFLIVPALPCLAQDINPQSRLVLHTTIDIDQNWFATNWLIGNIKKDRPDNINIFPGVGYRNGKWWAEAMVQRQWSKPGDSWALDFRFGADITSRTFLYLESAPFLSRSGEYEFLFCDIRTWKQVSFGVETENVHVAGRDSIGAGPRLSFPVASIGGYKLALGATYQIRRGESDVPRLYLVLNRRFKR